MVIKTKIINILHHPPAYEAYRDSPRPEINWDTPNGSWVGIWGYDWPDVTGNEVLKITDEFDYEVWQPDLRADKIYSHRFENGLVHRLFPAKAVRRIYGMKIVREVISNELTKGILEESNKRQVILHINAVTNYLSYQIIKNNNMPFLAEFHSKSIIPSIEKKKFRKNILANFYYRSVDSVLKNKKIYFVYNNSHNYKELFKYNPIGVDRIFMGVSFNEWTPMAKTDAKKYFGINNETKVLSMASRLNSLKQIDRIINTAKKLNQRYDFKLLIAGHGEEEYEKYLKNISSKLIEQGKLEFTGYLTGEEMLRLYQASDLFISASTSEGGPVSVMKAIACETPVMCTRVGGVDDILAEHNAGILVDPFDYNHWEKELISVLEGKEIKILDRKIAREHFHWPNIAKRFVDIYRKLEGCNA